MNEFRIKRSGFLMAWILLATVSLLMFKMIRGSGLLIGALIIIVIVILLLLMRIRDAGNHIWMYVLAVCMFFVPNQVAKIICLIVIGAIPTDEYCEYGGSAIEEPINIVEKKKEEEFYKNQGF